MLAVRIDLTEEVREQQASSWRCAVVGVGRTVIGVGRVVVVGRNVVGVVGVGRVVRGARVVGVGRVVRGARVVVALAWISIVTTCRPEGHEE